jgi:uncharacterized paraquat-inducible protein A
MNYNSYTCPNCGYMFSAYSNSTAATAHCPQCLFLCQPTWQYEATTDGTTWENGNAYDPD